MGAIQWSEGYFSEINYPDNYTKEMSPLHINFSLLLNGYDIKVSNNSALLPQDGFSYLELGFGLGSSLCIHAACFEGRFMGTDFNPNHALHAQKIISETNAKIELFDYSFEELYAYLTQQKEKFDYIIFHGVLSWINAKNAQIIMKIVKDFLKVGGVVYCSYNCFPGWSSKMGAREILFLRHQTSNLHAQESIQDAVNFFGDFIKAKPFNLYSETNPIYKNLHQDLVNKSESRLCNYIAHEYFNEEWNVFYFHQIAAMLETAKCSFACRAKPWSFYEDLHIAPEGITFLNTIKDKIFREQLKDFYTNEQFRVDLFCKGIQPLTRYEQEQRLSNIQFVLIKSTKNFEYTLNTPRGDAKLHEDIYAPILEILEESSFKPKTMREIAQRCNSDFSRVLNAIVILMHKGVIAPALEITPKIKSQTALYNKKIFQKHIDGFSENSHLACPMTACGLAFANIHIIMLKALNENNKITAQELSSYLCDIYYKTDRRITSQDGKPIMDKAQHEKEAQRLSEEFLQIAPLYRALGIIN